jgi:hypothetical protein
LQIAIAVLIPATAAAGVIFDFTAEAPNFKYGGTMTLDGQKSRADLNSGQHPLFNGHISHITRKEGDEILVVDHSRQSYFQRNPPPEMRGPLATVTGIGRSTLRNSQVTKTREKLGERLERHVIRADYDVDMEVEGEKLDASVELVIEMDVDPSREQRAFPNGMMFGARTGFKKLDWAIADRIPNRLPLRQVVRASRQIGGGPMITEEFTFLVTNIREEAVDDKTFFAPVGYRYEEPVFSFGQ